MNDKRFARAKAIAVLECMAIDLTGALAESSKTNPMTEVLERRLEAIDTAQDALRERPQWISVEESMPDDWVSVLGYMTDAGEFPPVRECYAIDGNFWFPALHEIHPVSHWMPMPEPPKEEV